MKPKKRMTKPRGYLSKIPFDSLGEILTFLEVKGIIINFSLAFRDLKEYILSEKSPLCNPNYKEAKFKFKFKNPLNLKTSKLFKEESSIKKLKNVIFEITLESGIEEFRKIFLQNLGIENFKLKITDDSFKEKTHLPLLQGIQCLYLDTDYGEALSDEGLKYLKGIKHLHVDAENYCYYISSTGLENLKGIESLEINCENGGKTVPEGFKHLKGIKNLFIGCCGTLQRKHLSHLIGIEKFSFAGNGGIIAEDLKFLGNNVRSLTLWACDKIQNKEELYSFIYSNPNLEYINIIDKIVLCQNEIQEISKQLKEKKYCEETSHQNLLNSTNPNNFSRTGYF